MDAVEQTAETMVGNFAPWVRPLIIAAATVLLVMLARCIMRAAVKALGWTSRKLNRPQWLEIIIRNFQKPLEYFIRLCVLNVGGRLLLESLLADAGTALNILDECCTAGYILLLAWGFWRSSDLCMLLLKSAENRLDLNSGTTMRAFFVSIYHVVIAVFAGIAVLDICGVPVAGLLTGAGVVGLAISLSAQPTLTNIIAGITLVLEHPFGIGDYIILGDYEGTVEDISFRSTRICTPDNVRITVQNSAVSDAYIQNATRRKYRLWDFSVGVTYDADRPKLEKLMRDLRALLRAEPHIKQDDFTVTLGEFADSSINIRVRCYADTTAYRDFLELKSGMNLRIMDIVAADGCSFAFPSTSVYIEKTGPETKN